MRITALKMGGHEVGGGLFRVLYRTRVVIAGCDRAWQSKEAKGEMLREVVWGFERGKLVATAERGMSLIGVDWAVDACAGKYKMAVIVFD